MIQGFQIHPDSYRDQDLKNFFWGVSLLRRVGLSAITPRNFYSEKNIFVSCGITASIPHAKEKNTHTESALSICAFLRKSVAI